MSELNPKTIFSVLQVPLAITPRPFLSYAKALGISEKQVIEVIKDSVKRGFIRRVAGILKHNRAGYRCNAMVAFEVSVNECDNVGERLAGFSCISHCYRRTSYPDWPYNIYAMMHARNEQEYEENLLTMKAAIRFKSMAILPTVKEYKKSHYVMKH